MRFVPAVALALVPVAVAAAGCQDPESGLPWQDVPAVSDILGGDPGASRDVLPPGDTSPEGDARPGGDEAPDEFPGTDAEFPADTPLPGDPGTPADASDPGPAYDAAADASPPPVTIPFGCTAGTVTEGWNNGWKVAGKTRSFYADLPANPAGKPVGAVFVYHGFGDSVDNFKTFFRPGTDADPDHPVALIYPKSLAMQPPGSPGIEWSIFQSTPGDQNPDARFFEEILGCLATTVAVDAESVFVFGFSAGAIMTNMLHSRYPDVVRAVLSMSGAWFNDPAQESKVNTMGMATLDWADLAPGPGTVMMTHGGAQDTYGMMGIKIIDFEQSAGQAVPYLTARGRTVIDCPHASGHTNHPALGTAAMMTFFADHRGAGPSPYPGSGLPGWMPSGCTLHPPQ